MNSSWISRIVAIGALAAATVALADSAAAPAPSGEAVFRLPDTPYHYANLNLPAHFKTYAARRFDNTPVDNPITDAGATLGRVLFYDTRLSANGAVSCGTCHVQKNAFVDSDRFSAGYEGKRGDRHSLPLVEARYYPRGRFFWDERADTLEDQVLMPIQSKSEMGQTLPRLVEIIKADPQYVPLFQATFGDPQIDSPRIARALAQFVRSLVSYQSKYDEGRAQAVSVRADFANFTDEENRGKGLFLRNCGVCHMPAGQDAHFVTERPKNTSLDPGIRVRDNGVGDITLNASDMGMFKSPSLRNIEFTGPYMHDGRFQTLEAVINFYSRGGGPNPNRSPEMRRFGFGPPQRAELIAFLKTLSDYKFIADPKFSDPFVSHPQPIVSTSADQPIFASDDSDAFRPFGRRFGPRPFGGPPGRGPRGGRGPAVTVADVVARIMAMDRNGDGRITADELPERMAGVLARGDTNHDGALDKAEITAMATLAFTPPPRPGPPPPPGFGRGFPPPPPRQ